MAPALLVRGGETLYLVRPGGGITEMGRVGDSPEDSADRVASGFRSGLRAMTVERLRSAIGSEPVACEEAALTRVVAALGIPVRPGTSPEFRPARDALAAAPVSALRPFYLALAWRALGDALAAPEEVLHSLAREEVRVERAVGRESSAADQYLAGEDGPARRYVESAERLRRAYEQHHALLRGEIAAIATSLAPNLSALVGGPLAGRLILAAGGLGPLARMSGARLQLLGARRRPSPERGPRFGYLYRAPRMEEVPPGRQGAYARSLAALLVIAARADVHTHADLSAWLIGRRDRRVAELRRSR